MQGLIEGFPKDSLRGMKVAAFDTRIREAEVGKGLRFMMKIGDYAAPRIAAVLKRKGGNLVVRPEGFFVKDKEGPLAEGELERVTAWAKGIKG